MGEEAEHDEEAGAGFRDHAFVRVAPDCVFAQVRVDSWPWLRTWNSSSREIIMNAEP